MAETPAIQQPDTTPPPFVHILDADGSVREVKQLTLSGLRVGSWSGGCEIVLADIARIHLLLKWNGSRAAVLVLSDQLQSTLRDREIKANHTYAWDLDETIALGTHRLLLTASDVAPVQQPAPRTAATAPVSTSGPIQPETGSIRIVLGPGVDGMLLVPGQPTQVTVTLQNRTDEEQKVTFFIGIIPQIWYTVRNPEVLIPSRGTAQVDITIRVPRQPDNLPGQQAVEFRVEKPSDGEIIRRTLSWRVATFIDEPPQVFLNPRQQTVSTIGAIRPYKRLGSGTAHYTINLRNMCNESGRYTLSVTDIDPSLIYVLDKQQVWIEPGDTEYVGLDIIAPRQRLDEDRRIFTFAVRVASDIQPKPEPVFGRFEQVRPEVMLWSLLPIRIRKSASTATCV